MYKEDEGDGIRYYSWEIFDSLAKAIDFMAGIKSRHGEEITDFLVSETDIKKIDIPEIPQELVERKKKWKKDREEKERIEQEKKWKQQQEERDREEYERLKKKFGDD